MNKRIKKRIENERREKQRAALDAVAKIMTKISPALITACISYQLQTQATIYKYTRNK